MRAAALVLAVAAAGAAACGVTMRSVPFEGSAADAERLAGRWRGEYTVADHDRRGLIEFRLQASTREAFGDVLMIPDRFGEPAGIPERQRPYRPPERHAQLLAIRFVATDGASIEGSVKPYWDPDRHCQASASFLGWVDGGAITGTFVSTCEDGARAWRGRWHVERGMR
jgi:hypothetical protein